MTLYEISWLGRRYRPPPPALGSELPASIITSTNGTIYIHWKKNKKIHVPWVIKTVNIPRKHCCRLVTRGRRGLDCMVVRFTNTYAVSAHHH